MIVREHRHETIYGRMAHRTLGCLLGTAVALICVRLFSTDLPTMVIILAGSVWLRYFIQTGREGLGTQLALGMLITLVQGSGRSRTCPWMDRMFDILMGSAMLYLLIWIDPKEPCRALQGKSSRYL
jgi:uncharacterized membrane protein YccC